MERLKTSLYGSKVFLVTSPVTFLTGQSQYFHEQTLAELLEASSSVDFFLIA